PAPLDSETKCLRQNLDGAVSAIWLPGLGDFAVKRVHVRERDIDHLEILQARMVQHLAPNRRIVLPGTLALLDSVVSKVAVSEVGHSRRFTLRLQLGNRVGTMLDLALEALGFFTGGTCAP